MTTHVTIGDDLLLASAGTAPSWQGARARAIILGDGITSSALPAFYGLSSIEGKVRRISTPDPSRTVRLYHKGTGALVKQAQTDEQGNFLFQYLDDSQDYYVVAIDDLSVYDPAISPMVDLNA